MNLPLSQRPASRWALLAVCLAMLAALAWLAAPAAHADPPGTDLPCTPTSWSHGCGDVDAAGKDVVSGQPLHGNFKDTDQQGNAALNVVFSSDGASATFTSDKGLSDYTVAFCDGTIIDVGTVGGDQKTFTFSYDKPIRSIRVKAGTTNRTFLSDRCEPAEPPVDPHDPPVEPGPDATTLAIAKSTSTRRLHPGESATFTVVVRNTGAVTAEDVEVCDTPDANWSFVSASGFTPTVAGRESCYELGTIAAGASKQLQVKLRLADDATAGKAYNHAKAWARNAPEVRTKAKVRVICVTRPTTPDQVPVQKVEDFVGLNAGETRTVRLSCPTGRLMTDGSPRVDAVDQDTGALASVQVLASHSVAPGTYEFTLANTASGRAQVHLFGTCLPGSTANRHLALHLSDLVSSTQSWAPGRHAATLSCPSGQIPVAPGYALSGGTATLVTSEPNGSNGWVIGLDVSAPTSATLSIRCLDEQVGGADSGQRLVFTHELVEVDVAAGQTVSKQVICGQQAKSVVASLDLPPSLLLVGHEPQPKTQVFWLSNLTTNPLHGVIDLVCVGDRTAAAASCPTPPKKGSHPSHKRGRH